LHFLIIPQFLASTIVARTELDKILRGA